jgi:AbrB family looped-hinge helix DNA binding protein
MPSHYTQLSSRGQLVIPADIRDEMKLPTGTRFSVEREGNTLVLRPITPEFIKGLMGSTKGAGSERERMHKRDKER